MKKLIILFHSPLFDFNKNRFHIGGVETYLRNLFPICCSVGFEVHVIFPSDAQKVVQINDVWLHSVIADKGCERTLVRCAESIANPSTDLLLFSDSTIIADSSFRSSLAIQHGVYWDREEIHGCRMEGRVGSLILRGLQARRLLDDHGKVSRMICVDLNYVNWMRALSVNNRLAYIYIPNFADTSQVIQRRPDDGRIRIVFARRFESIRGCGLLMEVMPRVLAAYSEVDLVVAGSGSMEDELRAAFEGNQNVVVTRYDAGESVAFHSQFDIALIPSVASEGTSLSLLEAMAAGCAVIATDVGGMSNVVLSGHNGLLVRPEAEDFYAGICSLLTNVQTRERLSRNARQTVEDSFSRDRWSESWANLLGEFV